LKADHHVRRAVPNEGSEGSDTIPFDSTLPKMSDALKKNRKLQGIIDSRDCNEEFSLVTSKEIGSIFDLLIESIDPTDSSSTKKNVNLALKYNVKVSKVCLKCSQIGVQDLETSALMNTSPYGFQSYCSENKYGSEATHSALVFSPVDFNTGKLLPGKLRGLLVGHDTAIDVDSGPTDLWPDSISSVLNEETLNNSEKIIFFQSFVSSLVAATTGVVAVMPDYIGYGESKGYDRAYLSPMVYEQAAAVSYAAAKRYISFISTGCTVLSDVASITGYGEGGYFAIRGASALEQNGVTILSSRPGGTPFDLDSQLGFSFQLEQAESSLLLSPSSSEAVDLFLAFFGYAYSNGFSFLSNSNSKHDALHSSWMDQSDSKMNMLRWFDSPESLDREDILALLPTNIGDVFNPAIIDLYRESAYEGYPKNACRSGFLVTDSTRGLCDAILDASLWNILLTEIKFPVSICHSPYDDIIGFENIPNPTTLPSNIKFYSSNLDILNPRGGHHESMFLCALDTIIYMSSYSDGDNGETDSPALRQALTNSPSQCQTTTDGIDTTENPTLPPSIDNNKCSQLYGGCEGTQECCDNMLCKIRRFGDGELSKICSPPNRSYVRTSIAEESVGGARRRKKKPGLV